MGGFEWFPRSQLDMRDMCSISISSSMTCFKRQLSQQTRSTKIEICYVFVGIICNKLLNGGGSYVAPWFQPLQIIERSFTIYEVDFDKERVGFMIQERRELEWIQPFCGNFICNDCSCHDFLTYDLLVQIMHVFHMVIVQRSPINTLSQGRCMGVQGQRP